MQLKKTIFNYSLLLFILLIFISNTTIAKSIEKSYASLFLEKIPNDTTTLEKIATPFIHSTLSNLENTSSPSNSLSKERFEIGAELGLFSTYLEYTLSYKEFSRGSLSFPYQTHYSMMNGLSLSHRLGKRWWLQTGLRYSRSTWSNEVLFEAFYDDTFEQVQPNGDVLYDLTLVSTGSINELETNVNVSVISALGISNGRLVVSLFDLEKRLDWLQIPIGLEYRLGKKELNYTIRGGVSLNQITTSNYNYEGLIDGHGARFEINEITYPQKDNKRFIGIYLGAGLRYELEENIALYGHINLRYEDAIITFFGDIFAGYHFGVSYSL